MASIHIRNVDKSYGDNHVVKNLTLEVESGSFTSLLGPSGCGKTTLLRMIAGFMAPDSGEILVDGKVMSSPTRSLPPEKRNMGMVFQQYAIWPHMDVFQNVAFGLQMAKVDRSEIPDRVREALTRVGLEDFERRGSGELSGGQQQRLALARALVTRPSILLLDEPLSNLDARLRERMRYELRELQQDTGITFVYVTHDQVEAMSMSDSIAIMQSGVLAQQGGPEELYREPNSEYVVDFLGLTNWFTGTLTDVDPKTQLGTVELDTGHRLMGSVPVGTSPGRRARVAVRPEDFTLTDGTGHDNVIQGTITQSLFMGSYVHHYLELPGRDEEVVIQGGRGTRFTKGQVTSWRADPALTRIIPATTGAGHSGESHTTQPVPSELIV
jgi:ABC-type Fe3+/spermidine/putrescine transport system ATPase subunit